MNRSQNHRISAFTIFEVTIVLAIMSVIVSMVTFSVNRLFDQLHVSEEIHAKLNNFYKVRSTLWYDYTTADSLVCTDQKLQIYKYGEPITYLANEGNLLRVQSGMEYPMNIEVKRIEEIVGDHGSEIIVLFDWNGEELPWRFFSQPDYAESVNQFFNRRNG